MPKVNGIQHCYFIFVTFLFTLNHPNVNKTYFSDITRSILKKKISKFSKKGAYFIDSLFVYPHTRILETGISTFAKPISALRFLVSPGFCVVLNSEQPRY